MENKKPLIVLVDDDEIDRRAFSRCLGDYNCQFIAFPTAEDALGALSEYQNRPLVLIVDINLPGISGIEMLEEIRASSNLKTIVTFVLSSSKREEDLIEAYNFNIAGYLRKLDYANMQKNIALLKAYLDVNIFPE